jgi:hypothetical protein
MGLDGAASQWNAEARRETRCSNGSEKDAQPSLESLSFDAASYVLRDSPASIRAWSTPDGDGLGLYFFAKPPDIPVCKELDELRSYYDAQVRPAGGAIAEASLLWVDGCLAVKAVVKVPQPQSGLTYVASITIPFREFSFVFKVQCEERGATGVREAVLLDRLLGAGAIPEVIDGGMRVPGFDPDNERFDVEFPMHPLSRARRAIHHVATTAHVEAAIKKPALRR